MAENRNEWWQQAFDGLFSGVGYLKDEFKQRWDRRSTQQDAISGVSSEMFTQGVTGLASVDNFLANVAQGLGRIISYFTGGDTFGLMAFARETVSAHRLLPEDFHTREMAENAHRYTANGAALSEQISGVDSHNPVISADRADFITPVVNTVTSIPSFLDSGAQVNENFVRSGFGAIGLGDFVDQGGLIGAFRRWNGEENTRPIDLNPMNWFQADATAGTPTPDTGSEFDSAAPNTPENQERDRALNEGTPAIPAVTGQTLEATREAPALIQ